MKIVKKIKNKVKPFIDQASYASQAYVESKAHIIEQSSELINFDKPAKSAADKNLLTLVNLLKV